MRWVGKLFQHHLLTHFLNKTIMDIAKDMNDMHTHYGVQEVVDKMDAATLREFLKFRLDFIREELNETYAALENGDAEEIVDGCTDLIVVASGTLDLLRVDQPKAWNEVLRANMTKEVGIKEGRPNPLGLPDLCKPKNWQAPSHAGNHGLLTKAFSD